jgi:hypothetical protein
MQTRLIFVYLYESVSAGQEVLISHPRKQNLDDERQVLGEMKVFGLIVDVVAVEEEELSLQTVGIREVVAT